MRGTQYFILVVLIVGAYFLGANSFNPFARHDAAQWWRGTLQADYDSDNAKYFNGELPPAVIHVAEIPEENGQSFLGESGRGMFGAFEIRIDPRLNVAGQTARITLLHEECHTWLLYHSGDGDRGHGERFQACEQHLLQAGAMNDLF